jgi:hypothetical protein
MPPRPRVLSPDRSSGWLRSISSVQMAVVEGGPRLGDLESGAVATAVPMQFSIVSGGIARIVGAVGLVGLLPGFRRFGGKVVEIPGDGAVGS